jgi:site-specific recombinase XerD
MTDTIAAAVERFIAHKRAHGRKYHSEARELALLVRFAAEHQVSRLSGLTPALLEDFLASRPRPHPRSFNHLLGVVRCLLDWTVTWGLLEASPLQARRRRVTERRIPFLFDPAQARRLLDAAAALAGNPRAPARGLTYRAIFALCHGLGLRAGEACGLTLGDIDAGRSLLTVRGGKFGKTRLVPHGPSIAWSPGLASPPPRESRRRPCTASATRLLSAACSAGIGRAWTPRPGSTICPRSWATSILIPLRST